MAQENTQQLIVRSIAEYRKVRGLAKGVKQGNTTAINFSSRLLASTVRNISETLRRNGMSEHIVLVPVPGHNGVANYTLDIARKVGKILNLPVENALLSDIHAPLFQIKKQQKNLDKQPLEMVQVKRIPKGMTPVLIDNVLDTGRTIDNAVAALESDNACLAVIGDTGKYEKTDLSSGKRVNDRMVFSANKVSMLMRDVYPVKGDIFKLDGMKYTVLDSDNSRGYMTTVDTKGKIRNWDLFAEDNTLITLSIPKFTQSKKATMSESNERYVYYHHPFSSADADLYPKKGLVSAEPIDQRFPDNKKLVYDRRLTLSELRIYKLQMPIEELDRLVGMRFLRKTGNHQAVISIDKHGGYGGANGFEITISTPKGDTKDTADYLTVYENIERGRWKVTTLGVQKVAETQEENNIHQIKTEAMKKNSKPSVRQDDAAVEQTQSAAQEKTAKEDMAKLEKAKKKYPEAWTEVLRSEYAAKMKGKNPGTLILVRAGDFYKAYGDDARDAMSILRTPVKQENVGNFNGRNNQPTLIPGKPVIISTEFPHHTLDTYLPKLIRAGKRVAICDDVPKIELTPSYEEQEKTNVKNAKDAGLDPGYVKKTKSEGKKKEKFIADIRGCFEVSKTKVAVFPSVGSKDGVVAGKGNEGISLDRAYLWDDGISFGGLAPGDDIKKRRYYHPDDIRPEFYDYLTKEVAKALVPELVTENEQFVYNLRAVESKNGKYYLCANLDNVGLHPKAISKEDYLDFTNGKTTAKDIFAKYYPTKMAKKLTKDEFCDMSLSDGSAVTKVNVYKQDKQDKPHYGEYMIYVEKGNTRLPSMPLSYDQLDAWFDRTVSKGQLAEQVMGEKLHLESAYKKYQLYVPEDVQDMRVRLIKDIKGDWNIQVSMDGLGETSRHILNYDDKCSLFGHTATKEQLAAKYLNDEIKDLSQNIRADRVQSQRLAM